MPARSGRTRRNTSAPESDAGALASVGDHPPRTRSVIGDLAYITGSDDDGPVPLCRLRYTGSPDHWGFACYLASKDRYEDSILPTGNFTGTPEQALDSACGLYLNDPTAWAERSRENF